MGSEAVDFVWCWLLEKHKVFLARKYIFPSGFLVVWVLALIRADEVALEYGSFQHQGTLI